MARFFVLAVMFVCGFVASANHAFAKTVYVATNGKDTNSGAQSAPYLTLKKALESVTAGDSIVIRSGTYNQSIRSSQIKIPSGTSWTKAITIEAYPGETVILRPNSHGGVINLNGKYSYLIFKNLIIDAGLSPGIHAIRLAAGANHNRFLNVEVRNAYAASGIHTTGSGSTHNEFINLKVHSIQNGSSSNQYHGIYIQTADNLIEGGSYYNNAYGYGVHLYNSGGGVHRNVVRNVRIYNNQKGMVMGSGHGNVAYNNLIYDNAGISVDIGWGAATTAGVFVNNTVIGKTSGVIVDIRSNASNTEFANNIVMGHAKGIRDSGKSTVMTANLLSDPLFQNLGAKDFRLRSGSPAIDKGISTSIRGVTADFIGRIRAQGKAYDIGAYEF